MNGGSVRIIPIPNGWKVPAAGVQVLEGADRLFLVGTPLATIWTVTTGLLMGLSNLPLDRLLPLV